MSSEGKRHEAKPFLKWAGSKRWLVPHIHKFIPHKFNRYFEPFLGSAALFFKLRTKRAQLSDLNDNLITTYRALRENPNNVISALKRLTFDYPANYYYVRDEFKSRDIFQHAARIIFLNRTCWNGLYRENSQGEFNVPIGRYINPKICDQFNLLEVSQALRDASFKACDFADAVKNATAGDLIIFDPPYITGHKNNGFHAYNEKLFKWEDQERLSAIAKTLYKKKHCYVLITNASHRAIRALYRGFKINKIKRNSLIAANIRNRGIVDELIIMSPNFRTVNYTD